MRAFFVILLLCNLGLLAYQIWTGTAAEPVPRAQEINAEKVVSLDPERLPPPQRRESEPVPLQEVVPAAPPGAQCFDWGTFEAAAADDAESMLKQRLPEVRFTRVAPDGVARYWVFIPAAPTSEETQARIARLKRKGAGDVVVIREDAELRGAVSLGIYSTTASAQRRLAELERLNIRGARALERRTGTSALHLILRNVDPALRPNLEALVDEVDNTALREVACPQPEPARADARS